MVFKRLFFETYRDTSNNIKVHPYHLWDEGGNACRTVAANISMKFIVFRDVEMNGDISYAF